MAVKLCALRSDRPLPQEDFWHLFLLGAKYTQGNSVAGRVI
jgi:hypothetical protein